MAIVKLFYKTEEDFGFQHFNEDFTLEQCMGAPLPIEFEGWDIKYIDSSEKPEIQEPCKMYFDKIENKIKIDENWDVKLMPCAIIARKHRMKHEEIILEEILKELPNTNVVNFSLANIEVAKKIGREKLKEKAYNLALKGLDERVAKGEPDKPVIRQKLQAKIQELELTNGVIA